MGWEDNLETETDFIPKLMTDTISVEHVKLLLELSDTDKKSVFDMIEFLYKKAGINLPAFLIAPLFFK